MICLRDYDISRMFTVNFTIFAANFNTMKFTKDQKNLLKGSLAGWAGMIVAMVFFVIFGKRTWSDTLWLLLGFTMVEIIVGAFLVFGSRVPKKKNAHN